MKILLSLTTILIFQFNAIASDTIIDFRSISYAQAFELAKTEKKAVLLYFHFDGCGACKKMEKTTFINENVARFYNSNFVCLEVNTRKGDGVEVNKIYNIQMHPTFLFLDENENILHKIVGVYNPEEYVLQAKKALSQIGTLTDFKQQYSNGNRESQFLFEFCYMLRDALELDSLLINEYLNTQNEDELSEEENIKFIYEFAIHNHKTCITSENKAYDFMSANKTLFTSYFDLEQVETRLMFITLDNVYQAIEVLDTSAFLKAIEKLRVYDTGKDYDFKEMDGRTTLWTNSKSLVLSAEMEYYQKTEESEKYTIALNKFLETIWDDSKALNSMAWNSYENDSDNAKLEQAVRCVKRSIELNSNYNNNDTYAFLLYKLMKFDDALKIAERAIELAIQSERDYTETANLIEKIKDEQKK